MSDTVMSDTVMFDAVMFDKIHPTDILVRFRSPFWDFESRGTIREVPGLFPRSSAGSTDDWDQHWEDLGDEAEGNPANLYRQRLILHALQSVPPGARILDIGSGQGELAMLLGS